MNKTWILLAAFSLDAAAASAAPDVVPLEFFGGIPFVTVTIGSSGPVRMMFDSGGMLGLSVPDEVIAKAGTIKLLEEKQRFTDLLGKAYEVPLLRADRVAIGTTRLDSVAGRVNVEWGGSSPDQELETMRKGGAIGLEALPERPLMFDYQNRSLSIYAAGQALGLDGKHWQTHKLGYGKEGPFVMLKVSGKAMKFVLDTGAQVNVIDKGKLECGVKCPRPRLNDLRDDDGDPLLAQDAEQIDLHGAPFDGILGAPFFRSYRVVFDLKNHQLHTAPALEQ